MYKVLMCLLMFLAGSTAWAQKDYKQGHPLVSAYQGAQLRDYSAVEHFEATFPMSAVPEDINQGQSYSYKYDTPEGASMQLVTTNYNRALRQAGMELLFECGPKNCGKGIVQLLEFTKRVSTLRISFSEDSRLMLYRLAKGQQNVYVLVAVYDAFYGPRVYQVV